MPLLKIIPLFTGIILLITSAARERPENINRLKSYLAVFENVGDFDSSYLTVLGNRYTSALPDILRLSIGNDLACYCSCRKEYHYNHSL